MDTIVSVTYLEQMAKELRPELAAAVRELESEGFVIKRKVSYVKKTFNIDKDQLTQINDLRERAHMKLQDVFSEALDLWIKAKTRELAPPVKGNGPRKSS